MPTTIGNLQLGKAGLTENFLKTLESFFKKHRNVKISVLKSCCRNKQEVKELSEEILNSLGNNYTSKIIGYTIMVKKWRKPVKTSVLKGDF